MNAELHLTMRIQNTSEQNLHLLWNYNDYLKNKVYMLKRMQVK